MNINDRKEPAAHNWDVSLGLLLLSFIRPVAAAHILSLAVNPS
ncbi:hypothetical protein [Paenibacillus agricola]|nr:hypothetical protein [Paenibacillus agricola]